MTPFVIPIFIAHQGCPHRCIFCDQYTIAGNQDEDSREVTAETVKSTIRHWLQRPRKDGRTGVQVAFYGGSFTGLPMARQRELLDSVQPYIASGQVNSIRISTRPDYIDENIADFLQEQSVTIVELGIQSLDQDVLEASSRGHSVLQAENALKLLKKRGFTVGAQLMCGLPGDNTSKLMDTVNKTAAMAPDFVRIYPTVVIRGSGLDKLYRDGSYKPLSVNRALALCGSMKEIFDRYNIRVVRMGLQVSEELADKVVAGPYHPAFGELVMARNLFKKCRKILSVKTKISPKCLSIAAADESIFRGPDNVSTKRLASLGLLRDIEVVFDKKQARNTVLLYRKDLESEIIAGS